jgi:hypothetical protein
VTGARALDWLRPTAIEPVRCLTSDRCADDGDRRDGLLVEVWPGVLRARDLPPGPAERVAAVHPLLPRGAVVARQAAVWAHTGRHRPRRLDVVLDGTRHRSTGAVLVHAERLHPADVLRIGGGAVTSPARTAVDVARWADPADVADWVAALLLAGLRRADLGTALERAAGLPGIGRARDLLARAVPRVPGAEGSS